MHSPISHITTALLPFIFLFVIVLSGCDDNSFQRLEPSDIGPFDTTGVEKFTASNGLTIYFHEEGDGDMVVERHTVLIRYSGRTPDGNLFDSSKHNGNDTPASLAVNGTVKGFMQGLAGVNEDGVRKHAARVGSKRTLVIPPELGYTSSSHQLYGDTLIFDIDLVNISTTN